MTTDEPDATPDAGALAVPDEPAPVDEAPLTPQAPVAAERVEPVVVPHWMQAVGLTVALFGVFALARSSGPVLLLFVVAAVLALILNPLVKLLQRAGLPRGPAIAAVLLGFTGLVAGTVALLVNPVSDQVQAFQAALPGLIDNANASLTRLQEWLDRRGLDVQVAGQGETALEALRSNVLQGSGDVLTFARDLVTVLLEASFALVLVLVISIYMLLYGKQIGALVRRVMPDGDGTPEDDFPIRVQKAVFGYVRGQTMFSLVMGVSAGSALWLFGVLGIFPAGKTYAIFFGVFYGLMELIPYLGPVLGSTPPVLVALLQGEPLTALWLVLLFLLLQQVEGHVVAPQIFSHSLRINPLVVMFVLLLGGHLYGIVGALVALPLAAIARETAIYLRRHLVLEPWGTPSARALRETPTGPAPSPVRRRCPECGTSSAPGAEFCFACGAPVRPQVVRRDRDAQAERRPAVRGARTSWRPRLPRWPSRPRRPGSGLPTEQTSAPTGQPRTPDADEAARSRT